MWLRTPTDSPDIRQAVIASTRQCYKSLSKPYCQQRLSDLKEELFARHASAFAIFKAGCRLLALLSTSPSQQLPLHVVTTQLYTKTRSSQVDRYLDGANWRSLKLIKSGRTWEIKAVKEVKTLLLGEMASKTYIYRDLVTGAEMFNVAHPHVSTVTIHVIILSKCPISSLKHGVNYVETVFSFWCLCSASDVSLIAFRFWWQRTMPSSVSSPWWSMRTEGDHDGNEVDG